MNECVSTSETFHRKKIGNVTACADICGRLRRKARLADKLHAATKYDDMQISATQLKANCQEQAMTSDQNALQCNTRVCDADCDVNTGVAGWLQHRNSASIQVIPTSSTHMTRWVRLELQTDRTNYNAAHNLPCQRWLAHNERIQRRRGKLECIHA